MKASFLVAALILVAGRAHAADFVSCTGTNSKIEITYVGTTSLHEVSPQGSQDVTVDSPIALMNASDVQLIRAQGAISNSDASNIDLSKSYKAGINGKTQYMVTFKDGGQFLVYDGMSLTAPCPK